MTPLHSLLSTTYIAVVLVNPGKLTLNFDPNLQSNMDNDAGVDDRAEGVVTVKVTGSHPSSAKAAGSRWVTLRLGNRKYQWPLPVQQEEWSVTYTFLVHDLEQDVVRGVAST